MPSEIRSRSWPWIAIGVSVAVALFLAMVSPADTVQGELVRIMYVHVPAAWLAYLAFTVTLVGSVGYLVTRKLSWDRVAASSAEIGVYFTGLAIGLGMIWAKPTWGVWWTWDARLTLTAVMFFVYVGYLALRRATPDPEARARRSAILGTIAVIQVPLVYFSVNMFRTLHQTQTIRPDGAAMPDEMLVAMLINVAVFTFLYIALMVARIDVAKAEASAAQTQDLAGDAVKAPLLSEVEDV